MTPTSVSSLPDGAIALTLGLLLLAPLAIAGLALVNTGLGRSRSAAQSLLGALVLVSATLLLFSLGGASLASSAFGAPVVAHFAGKPWNLSGTGLPFLSGIAAVPAHALLSLLFECMAVAMAVLIPWGSGADRFRLTSGIAAACALALLVFPFAAHWVWNDGWLAQLGANFSLGTGFLDAGGAAPVHLLGGLSALAVIWIIGPRRGKFPREGLSTAMPGHNAIYVLFGCAVALVGWLAWNLAGAELWLNAPVSALPVVAINTALSAAAALIATFVVTHIRFTKPDASLCANGWLAGLVASSACSAVVTPFEAALVGLISGIATPILVEVFELAVSIDDPTGAIAAHAVSAAWGLFAAGLFAPQKGQLLAQLIGIATFVGLFFPAIYLLFWLINRVLPFRVEADGERIGMDLHELGGGAYPEFVVHRDDSYR